MKKIIRGRAFVVGDNVDTDQIIPARYLSYNPADSEERKYFGRYAMSGVPAAESGLPEGNKPFVAEGADKSDFAVIVAGRNFGCGSSREHAPIAIAAAGCMVVVAESHARLFYRNSINGGHLIPSDSRQRLVGEIKTGDEVEVNCSAGALKNLASGEEYELGPLGDVADIIEAGGLFQYARKTGMLK
ncbi:MAG: LeuD/DmdB family oxidoreductase small subunit [Planctomycetota bacterium]|jgi:3-isopropylmalate/(R)-2-methylmalate dehydratase small subunit